MIGAVLLTPSTLSVLGLFVERDWPHAALHFVFSFFLQTNPFMA